jgi:lipopolysaccharide transport system permease protein
MVAVVEGFRWSILGTGEASTSTLGISGGVLLLVLVSGLYYFRRMERTFADVV